MLRAGPGNVIACLPAHRSKHSSNDDILANQSIHLCLAHDVHEHLRSGTGRKLRRLERASAHISNADRRLQSDRPRGRPGSVEPALRVDREDWRRRRLDRLRLVVISGCVLRFGAAVHLSRIEPLLGRAGISRRRARRCRLRRPDRVGRRAGARARRGEDSPHCHEQPNLPRCHLKHSKPPPCTLRFATLGCQPWNPMEPRTPPYAQLAATAIAEPRARPRHESW